MALAITWSLAINFLLFFHYYSHVQHNGVVLPPWFVVCPMGGEGVLLSRMFRAVSSSSFNTLTSSSYKCTPWFTPFDTPLTLAISLQILSNISYQIIHIEGVTLISFGFCFSSWYFSLIFNHLSHTYFHVLRVSLKNLTIFYKKNSIQCLSLKGL
jgi:hypothetical protein